METITPGQIHLADRRLLDENSTYRRYSSFSNSALGGLNVFNDELLAAGKAVEICIAQSGYLVLLPVTGAVICDGVYIDVEEVWIKPVVAGQLVVLNNPYPDDWINYLVLQIAVEHYANNADWKMGFNLLTNAGKLVNLTCNTLPFKLQIGRFNGRSEALYQIEDGASLYAFVIAGAFEVQGRLLHQRDGLTLWDVYEVDLEALSNDAVMLLLELPH